MTEAELNRRFLKYRMREADFYAEHTTDPESATAAGKELIAGLARFGAGEPFSPGAGELLAAGERAARLGAHDSALELYLTAVRLLNEKTLAH